MCGWALIIVWVVLIFLDNWICDCCVCFGRIEFLSVFFVIGVFLFIICFRRKLLIGKRVFLNLLLCSNEMFVGGN